MHLLIQYKPLQTERQWIYFLFLHQLGDNKSTNLQRESLLQNLIYFTIEIPKNVSKAGTLKIIQGPPNFLHKVIETRFFDSDIVINPVNGSLWAS